jgi:DNA sulfur modification protein DndD
LFEDDFFENKQLVLACHGEEFFKDIQNLLSAERVEKSKTFVFLPKKDESHIRVDFNCTPRNYIIASRSHFDKNEIRDSLDKSRKALESLSKGKLWVYVRKYGNGNLSIKMCSATAPIGLRNLTEQLRSKIAKTDFSALNKSMVLKHVDDLLGIDGDSREWRYLNKGTHEESGREEFDRQVVGEIVTLLELLDAVLS